MDQNFTLTTSGEFTTDEQRILQGTGQVEFTEDGFFQSQGVATVTDFTGITQGKSLQQNLYR